MDFELYQQKIKAINEELKSIADQAFTNGWAGRANNSNPHFVAALSEQERLIELVARLYENLIANQEE